MNLALGFTTYSQHLRMRRSSLRLSLLLCGGILLCFFLYAPTTIHWFVLPTFACGVATAPDVIDVLRRRIDIYDPVSIVGIVSFHGFFVAPLLHVAWDFWMGYVTPPTDWRPWLGAMSVLNAIGLVLYRFVRSGGRPWRWKLGRHEAAPGVTWQIKPHRFITVAIPILAVAFILQTWIYWRFGGIDAYMAAYSQRVDWGSPFEGYGRIFIIAECFPYVAAMLYVVLLRWRNHVPTWKTLALVGVIFFFLSLYFGGLRGSRSNVVWNLFWLAGLVHLCVRRINRLVVALGIGGLVAFMFLYGLYKAGGVSTIDMLLHRESSTSELAEETGRTYEKAVLRDFARADLQAFMLFRYFDTDDYKPALGRTYAAALLRFVPERFWPDRPPGRVKEGSQLIHGGYIPGYLVSSYVYGAGGEALLNFGPFAIPLSFIVVGFFVRFFRNYSARLPLGDTRWALVPFFTNFCLTLLIMDSDNIVYFLVVNGTVPLIAVFLGSRVVRRPAPTKSTVPPRQQGGQSLTRTQTV